MPHNRPIPRLPVPHDVLNRARQHELDTLGCTCTTVDIEEGPPIRYGQTGRTRILHDEGCPAIGQRSALTFLPPDPNHN